MESYKSPAVTGVIHHRQQALCAMPAFKIHRGIIPGQATGETGPDLKLPDDKGQPDERPPSPIPYSFCVKHHVYLLTLETTPLLRPLFSEPIPLNNYLHFPDKGPLLCRDCFSLISKAVLKKGGS